VEQELGALPPDLREMVQIANGFRGARHLAGGGFPRVDELRAEPSENYEVFLGDFSALTYARRTESDPDGTTGTTTMRAHESSAGSEEDMGQGQVWVGAGTEENCYYQHVVCPPKTWRKLNEAFREVEDDESVTECGDDDDGEYKVIQFAHWESGGHTTRA
jgi:hypothetical protein